MRSIVIVAAAALTAVAVLVVTATPGRTVSPGPVASVRADDLARVTLPVGDEPGAVPPTLDPAARGIGALDAAARIPEPAVAPLPTGRPATNQPGAALGVVVKPTPTPRPTPTSSARAGSGGGSGGGARSGSGTWRTAGYSWYGPGFYGNGTACGQTYSKEILGTAHRSLPCGTRVTFRNPANGRTITVPVIDRGPYVDGRSWDLSYATCTYLRNCHTGTIQYRLP